MATTSPDNLRTPNPGDPYNLVADLATLAGDVQSALNTRANTYTGTASQRAAFLSTATVGTLWQDTDGIGMLWKRGASQWVPAVWRWSGSTAQMNAFTQAPDGFEWFNTSTGISVVRKSGAWFGVQWTSSGFTAGAVGTTYREYRISGNRVDIRLALSSALAPSEAVQAGTVPVLVRPSREVPLSANGNGGVPAAAYLDPAGIVRVRNTHSNSITPWVYGSYTLD